MNTNDLQKNIKTLESRLGRCLTVDKIRLRRELSKIKRQKSRDESQQNSAIKKIQGLQKRAENSISKINQRKKNIPKLIYNENLPITQRREEIVETIRKSQVIILSGETGSGKTTQIPKFCLEAGRGIFGKIACTQPRRIAAVTVAGRLAEEMEEPLGKSVGYKIRFQDKTDHNSYLKVMTDGILLAETQNDPYLNEYDTIIVDEAHERSLNIDFILGILSGLLARRKDLKVIITSATIDTEKFSKAFGNAPVIEVSGRTYPVETRYVPPETDPSTGELQGYVELAVQMVDKLQQESPYGDILIFMPTEADIRETCEMLEGRKYMHVSIMPLYARLSAKEQARVFSGCSGRKIVVSTNVAETSITIPGIKFVIDSGLARIAQYIPRSRTNALPVMQVSKSSADQRKGRCGRVENGVCIRLYDEKDYDSRQVFTLPEILRSNLAEVILRMISLKLGDIESFPFIDTPSNQSIKDGINILLELGAITLDKGKNAKKFQLTTMGRIMARLPIDPRLSRILIEGHKQGCLAETIVIASSLSISDVRERPSEKAQHADQQHAKYKDPASDFVTILNIWKTYHEKKAEVKSLGKMKKYCRDNFLSFKRIREWRDIHSQITENLKEHDYFNKPCSQNPDNPDGKKAKINKAETFSPEYTAIHKALLSGLLSNIAMQKEKNIYQATRGRKAMIFPGSGIFGKSSPWIMSAEMVETSQLFARCAANIDQEWLEDIGGPLCTRTFSEPHWEKKRGEVVAFEQVALFGLVIVDRRRISFGKINPAESTEIFIRSALVGGDVERMLPFMKHNMKLIGQVVSMEDKIRKRDILVDEEDLFQFYSEKIQGICDIRTFQKFLKDKGCDKFLRMQKEDLQKYTPEETELALYPDRLKLGHKVFRCDYKFDPGKKKDGLTVKIPASLAPTVPADQVDWMVPGLYREKISALIKALPKEHRKNLVPVSNTVETIVREMPRNEDSLLSSLGKFILERFKVRIPPKAWCEDALPDHLQMRIAITDANGKVIQTSRNKAILNREVSETGNKDLFESAKKRWERGNITSWDFKDLGDHIELSDPGARKWLVYPGLSVNGETISLKLFKDRNQAVSSHKKGVHKLYEIHFSREIKNLKKELKLPRDLKNISNYFGGPAKFEASLLKKVTGTLFEKNIRSQNAFMEHAGEITAKISLEGRALMQAIVSFMKVYHETRTVIYGLEIKSRSNARALGFLEKIRKEIDNMVPENFAELYQPKRMGSMERYLKASAIRAQRGYDNPEKDRAKALPVEGFQDMLKQALGEVNAETSDSKRDAIEDFYWNLEEFKVSVFAQELRTPVKVSQKLLKKKMAEINVMV